MLQLRVPLTPRCWAAVLQRLEAAKAELPADCVLDVTLSIQLRIHKGRSRVHPAAGRLQAQHLVAASARPVRKLALDADVACWAPWDVSQCVEPPEDQEDSVSDNALETKAGLHPTLQTLMAAPSVQHFACRLGGNAHSDSAALRAQTAASMLGAQGVVTRSELRTLHLDGLWTVPQQQLPPGLRELRLQQCDAPLKSLSSALRRLTALTRLDVGSCKPPRSEEQTVLSHMWKALAQLTGLAALHLSHKPSEWHDRMGLRPQAWGPSKIPSASTALSALTALTSLQLCAEVRRTRAMVPPQGGMWLPGPPEERYVAQRVGALAHIAPALQRLNIVDWQLSKEYAPRLAAALSHHADLRELRMNVGGCSTAAVKALGAPVNAMRGLTSLEVQGLSPDNAAAVSGWSRAMGRLRSFSCGVLCTVLDRPARSLPSAALLCAAQLTHLEIAFFTPYVPSRSPWIHL